MNDQYFSKHWSYSQFLTKFFQFLREILENELESVGIRLNKRKPEIYFKVLMQVKEYMSLYI